MNKPHKHAELIKAWADGAEIEKKVNVEWVICAYPEWYKETEYRIKPEKEYPKSSLLNTTISGFWACGTNTAYNDQYEKILRAVADAAVKKYIQENEE